HRSLPLLDPRWRERAPAAGGRGAPPHGAVRLWHHGGRPARVDRFPRRVRRGGGHVEEFSFGPLPARPQRSTLGTDHHRWTERRHQSLALRVAARGAPALL